MMEYNSTYTVLTRGCLGEGGGEGNRHSHCACVGVGVLADVDGFRGEVGVLVGTLDLLGHILVLRAFITRVGS